MTAVGRRRAWIVVLSALLSLLIVPLAAVAVSAAPGGNGNGNGGGNGNGNGGGNGNGNGGGNGNGNGGNPHNTTTTTCSYPFDNCPTTTTSRHRHPVVVLDLTDAAPGQSVPVTVCGYAPGTVVKVTFNGIVVATVTVGTEPPKTCTTNNVALGQPVFAAVGLAGAVRAQADTASGANTSFDVPGDIHPGSYLVCAVAAGDDTPCARLNVAGGQASVLGTTFSRNNGNALLAFTGLGLLRLLVLAAALIALGIYLARRRPRRRRA